MIRLLGAITGSALALAALLVFVGVPQFKAAPGHTVPAVVRLPQRVAPVEELPEEPVQKPVDQTVAQDEAEPAAEPEEVLVGEPPLLQPDTQQWYAFWSPFRSEIAASGFVTQLQRVTGLDYRVVKLEPGVYEVAFAYAANEDIPVNLSQISAATGLDMPGN